jgi:hypothetical protein
MNTYPYTPLELPGPSVRLLRIERGFWDEEIECGLFEAPLIEGETLPYQALSYTWGGIEHIPGFPALYIDKREINVKESLFLALRHIRCENRDIHLWVDALCINQDDEEEKGSQVNQMGRVYAMAEEVIVWLGASHEGVRPLFNLITEVDEKVKAAYSLYGSETWEALCRKNVTSHWDSPEIREALRKVLQAPWFERVWIL